MHFKQVQSPIWRTPDCKTTHIWWLVNMGYNFLKLWLLCCHFCPHKCTSIIIFGQVVFPNILGYQFCEINKKHHDACTNLSICFVSYVEKGCNFIHNMWMIFGVSILMSSYRAPVCVLMMLQHRLLSYYFE